MGKALRNTPYLSDLSTKRVLEILVSRIAPLNSSKKNDSPKCTMVAYLGDRYKRQEYGVFSWPPKPRENIHEAQICHPQVSSHFCGLYKLPPLGNRSCLLPRVQKGNTPFLSVSRWKGTSPSDKVRLTPVLHRRLYMYMCRGGEPEP